MDRNRKRPHPPSSTPKPGLKYKKMLLDRITSLENRLAAREQCCSHQTSSPGPSSDQSLAAVASVPPAVSPVCDDHNLSDVAADTQSTDSSECDPDPDEGNSLIEDITEEMLAILSENPPGDDKEQNQLQEVEELAADRLKPIILEGMPKESLEELMKKYEIPENYSFLISPKINPEIKSILSAKSERRDGWYVNAQNQLGRGILSLCSGINTLAKETEHWPDELRNSLLSTFLDSSKIFSDVFHNCSTIRRFLITPILDKTTKELTENTPPSDFLFGSELAEKVKAAKGLARSGEDLEPDQITRATYKGGKMQQKAAKTEQLDDPDHLSEDLVSANPSRPNRPKAPYRLNNRRGGRRQQNARFQSRTRENFDHGEPEAGTSRDGRPNQVSRPPYRSYNRRGGHQQQKARFQEQPDDRSCYPRETDEGDRRRPNNRRAFRSFNKRRGGRQRGTVKRAQRARFQQRTLDECFEDERHHREDFDEGRDRPGSYYDHIQGRPRASGRRHLPE